MAYRSLRDFIARLEEAGELVRVKEPVSTVLEMTEIQTRLIAQGGPAVIFDQIRGYPGRRLAIGVLTVNLVGDSLNALLRHDPRTLIGLPIGGLMILYLAKTKGPET